ncbi:MAG: hypothetical protein M3P18_09995 [Actinomycetota bacterium]|nr:hypothetical protein [Actinomycetota bacterium]
MGARGELTFVGGSEVDIPIITAVNGICAGGGLHFVADGGLDRPRSFRDDLRKRGRDLSLRAIRGEVRSSRPVTAGPASPGPAAFPGWGYAIAADESTGAIGDRVGPRSL